MGQKIYGVAQVACGAPDTKRLHKAVVHAISGSTVYIKYSSNKLGPRATSGAPWINEAGEVVGINVGSARMKGSPALFGYGGSAAGIEGAA